MAFYAGLFEAEGHVQINKRYVALELGQFVSEKFTNLIYKYLIKDEFQPKITKKLDKRVNKYFYVIRIASTEKVRKSDLKNFEQVLKVMNKNTKKYKKALNVCHP